MQTINPAVDRPLIRAFVEDFYTDVRQHEVIGPVFNDAIGDHWPEHFETLTDFWVTVLYGVYAYKGNPFLAHRKLSNLEDFHFDIWLTHFKASAEKCLPVALSEKACEKAERIAASLRQGLFFKAT